jgi:hypothetical protein
MTDDGADELTRELLGRLSNLNADTDHAQIEQWRHTIGEVARAMLPDTDDWTPYEGQCPLEADGQPIIGQALSVDSDGLYWLALMTAENETQGIIRTARVARIPITDFDWPAVGEWYSQAHNRRWRNRAWAFSAKSGAGIYIVTETGEHGDPDRAEVFAAALARHCGWAIQDRPVS